MLLYTLVFLCIGIYGNCMPAHKLRSRSTRRELEYAFNEMWNHLTNLRPQKFTVIPRNGSMMHAEISHMAKNCILLNLERYRNLFNSLDIKGPRKATQEYANMVEGLHGFSKQPALAKYLPPQTMKDQECETSREDIQEVPIWFEDFLRELSLDLKSNPTQ